MPFASVANRKSTPFSAAFSAQATAIWQGWIVAAVGSWRAARIPGLRPGSRRRASARLDDRGAGDAVLARLFEMALQHGQVLLVEGRHEGARPVQIHAQLRGQIGVEPVPLDVEPGHERAGARVVAGMDHPGVGLGAAAGHVVFPVDDREAQVIAGQLAGDHHPRDAGPDDYHVIRPLAVGQRESLPAER